MPEIPELEAFKYLVQSHCIHKKIGDIEASDTKVIKGITFIQFKKKLIHDAFTSVERKGKFLIITISETTILVMHFGLTGFLVYSNDSNEKVNHSLVNFIFKDNSILHWISLRKFGKIWLLKNINEIKELNVLGFDALTISKKNFFALTEKYKKKNIKSFLMDQFIIAGLGNEYSDEILFQAGIDPHHSLKELSENEVTTIYSQMQKILKYAIKLRINDIKKFPNQNFLSKNDKATFKSSYLQAHRHIDMVCPKNSKHQLKKVTIAGRSTYYCPKDQK